MLMLAASTVAAPSLTSAQAAAAPLECVVGLALGRDGSDPALAIEALATMGETLSERNIRLIASDERACLDEVAADACASLLEQHECDAILVVTIDPAGPQRPSPVLSIDLYDARGAELGLSRAFTSSPTLVAANLVNEAVQQWSEVQPVTWRIEGSPAGAAVQVDRSLGTLPFATTVRPGTHQLTVRAPGFVTHSQEVEIEAGDETFVTQIDLEAEEGSEVPSTPGASTPWQRIVGPIMLGVGVAGAAGVVIGSVASLGDDVDIDDGTAREELNLGPTLAYAALGVAVAAVGVILWLTAPKSNTRVGVGPDRLQVTHRF